MPQFELRSDAELSKLTFEERLVDIELGNPEDVYRLFFELGSGKYVSESDPLSARISALGKVATKMRCFQGGTTERSEGINMLTTLANALTGAKTQETYLKAASIRT